MCLQLVLPVLTIVPLFALLITLLALVSRRCSACPQPAARAPASHALGRHPPCGRRRERGWHLPFDSHRFLVDGISNGRRITEELCSCGGRVGNGGASSGGDSSAAATRRAVVCGGARRPGDRQAGCWWA